MSRLKNDYDFLTGIHINGGLYFNKYRLVLDLYTNTDTPQDQNIAFDRINYFLQEIIQRSIFASNYETVAIERYKAAGIPVLTVPQPGPYDQIVQAIIVTKLNAILEDTLVITEAEISSVAGGFVTYMWTDDDGDEIHELVNDEVDEMWWTAPEPRFVSLPVPDEDDEDEADEKKKAETLVELSWETLDLHWYEEATDPEPDVEIVFTPDASLTIPPSAAGSETVIKMSDFKDNK